MDTKDVGIIAMYVLTVMDRFDMDDVGDQASSIVKALENYLESGFTLENWLFSKNFDVDGYKRHMGYTHLHQMFDKYGDE